jgi:uncharacterized protein
MATTTAPTDADVEVIRAIYAAMGAADLPALLARIDPAIVVTQDERLPWGGRYEGHEGFGRFAVALRTAIDSQVTTAALFAADGAVYQAGRTRGTVRGTGAAFDIPEVHRWVVRDGRAVEAHFAIDTGAMLAALSASPPPPAPSDRT